MSKLHKTLTGNDKSGIIQLDTVDSCKMKTIVLPSP